MPKCALIWPICSSVLYLRDYTPNAGLASLDRYWRIYSSESANCGDHIMLTAPGYTRFVLISGSLLFQSEPKRSNPWLQNFLKKRRNILRKLDRQMYIHPTIYPYILCVDLRLRFKNAPVGVSSESSTKKRYLRDFISYAFLQRLLLKNLKNLCSHVRMFFRFGMIRFFNKIANIFHTLITQKVLAVKLVVVNQSR